MAIYEKRYCFSLLHYNSAQLPIGNTRWYKKPKLFYTYVTEVFSDMSVSSKRQRKKVPFSCTNDIHSSEPGFNTQGTLYFPWNSRSMLIRVRRPDSRLERLGGAGVGKRLHRSLALAFMPIWPLIEVKVEVKFVLAVEVNLDGGRAGEGDENQLRDSWRPCGHRDYLENKICVRDISWFPFSQWPLDKPFYFYFSKCYARFIILSFLTFNLGPTLPIISFSIRPRQPWV